MKIKYFGYSIMVLLFLYALDLMTFGVSRPVFNPTLNTFTDKVVRAFISCAVAGAIYVCVNNIKE